MKKKLLLVCGLFLVGFLLGFIPQYTKVWRLDSELAIAKQDLTACQFNSRFSEARKALAMSYLEVNRKNFGIAQEHASRFFAQAQKLVGETSDGTVKVLLQEILGSRDPLTAALANGDPSATTLLESLLMKLYGESAGNSEGQARQ